METFKISRDGFVTDRATGEGLGRVFRGCWIKPNGDGTGSEVDVWKAEDRHGRWGSIHPLYFGTRRGAAAYLAEVSR